MRRQVSYRWRLREIMAEHGMFATSDLVPLLAERGVVLSSSQVHRLVTGTPERLSLALLAALCDIFDATATDLVPTQAHNVASRSTVGGAVGGAAADVVADLADNRHSRASAVRPTRARIRPEQ